MITESAEEFAASIPKMHSLMGLDLGTKTIGVAISDRLWHVATASHVIARKKFTTDAEALRIFMAQNDIGGVVMGLPKYMDGNEGPRAQSARAFARNFERFEKPLDALILLWDERLSTVEAERAMIEADMSRKKRGQKIDAVAASLILRGALDRIQRLNHE